jgi:hypothetical protein
MAACRKLLCTYRSSDMVYYRHKYHHNHHRTMDYPLMLPGGLNPPYHHTIIHMIIVMNLLWPSNGIHLSLLISYRSRRQELRPGLL